MNEVVVPSDVQVSVWSPRTVASAAPTKAVVAIDAELSRGVGVGAVGFPVKTGSARGANAAMSVRLAALMSCGWISSDPPVLCVA